MSTQITYDDGNTKIEEKKAICLNRGRLLLGSATNDHNHAIYNNGADVDGEGSWDGMKINAYQGLKIRTGGTNDGAPNLRFEVAKTHVTSSEKVIAPLFIGKSQLTAETVDELPLASAELVGQFFYQEPTAGGSKLYICMRNETDSYKWKLIVDED